MIQLLSISIGAVIGACIVLVIHELRMKYYLVRFSEYSDEYIPPGVDGSRVLYILKGIDISSTTLQIVQTINGVTDTIGNTVFGYEIKDVVGMSRSRNKLIQQHIEDIL